MTEKQWNMAKWLYISQNIFLRKYSFWFLIYSNIICYQAKKRHIFNYQEENKDIYIYRLHDQLFLVPADKAEKNLTFVCKTQYMLVVL